MSKLKLKYLCSSFNTPLAAKELSLESENGMFPVYGAAGLMGYYSKYFVDKEYLGIVKDGAGVGRIDKYPAKSSLLGTMATIIPNEGVDIDWLKYAITSLDLGNSIDKTTIPHIYFSVYGNYYIRGITATEQKKMAKKLNEKCSYVDSLIANQEHQIEKLKAYKQSLITEVVTKGLNPDAPMKPSGVEWISCIPIHWETIRGKFVFYYKQKPVYENDEVITCFRDGEVTLRSKRREEGFTFAEKEIGYQGVDIGDLVVHGMDGFAGAIGISDSRGKASPVLNVLDSKQNKRYMMYYLRSMAYNNVFLATATGIRIRSCDLRWNKLSEFLYPIPPLVEQQQIVDYLDKKCAAIDRLIEIKQQKIEKLNDYKKSLIYEYVTGKKEVV
jgi:type I restriction enzyme S subunit